jgi:ABC-2 type transport system ATP-binding protein
VYDFKSRREELLDFTRLKPFRDRLAEKLSGGMKQKLGLACTLIHTPRVIFLDEPTTGVDPVSRRDFWRILQSLLKEGITIVMSTPYLDEAERCSRVGLMNQGTIMRVDAPEHLKQEMHGEVIEIVCNPIREAVVLLKALPGVREIQAFGDRLNVVVDHDGKAQTRLATVLRSHSVSVVSTRTIAPSLENVFLSLLTTPAQQEADG